MDKAKVKVVWRQLKGKFVLRWKSLETGDWKEKVAEGSSRKEAEKHAAQLEADLREGRYVSPSKLLWQDFRLLFEAEKLPSLARRTAERYRTSLNYVEKFLRPVRLVDLDAAALSRFQAKLRESGLREATIAAELRHVRAALSWAADTGRLVTVPKITKPPRAKKHKSMRGRPITGEEFERMLVACEAVRPKDVRIWRELLTGLWLSGLRLGEALKLGWDTASPFAVKLDGRYPCFLISAEAEKGFQDRQLPMTPDFAAMLMAIPREERVGCVFAVGEAMPRVDSASKIITEIGKTAGVIVDKAQGKFASAHDFRRAFGTRLAAKVSPAVLRELMRHSSIDTTMKYYVDSSAADIGRELERIAEATNEVTSWVTHEIGLAGG